MNLYIQELYKHQEWADAEHWRAFEAYPKAIEDKGIRERLVHIHLVQHAFVWIMGGQASSFEIKKSDDFREIAELKLYAKQAHEAFTKLLGGLPPERLEEVVEIVWFKPSLAISRRQALMQAAMHSHYHRGQNAARLRELGSVPPTTDFIVWLRDGQPKAKWE